MIAVCKPGTTAEQLSQLESLAHSCGVSVSFHTDGAFPTACFFENTAALRPDAVRVFPFVETVTRISEPYLLASRATHAEPTVVSVGGRNFGAGEFQIIAGPCTVESRSQILETADAVRAAGANLLRGGAYKPRTSPYDFQGLGEEGLDILLAARKQTGLPVVTELMSVSQLELFLEKGIDLIQIGARNMQNFDLLKAVGKTRVPVLLKRGFSNTLQELLLSAEYILREGNDRIVLCERGIRTFEPYTRSTLDLSAVPVLHEKTHLPVIVDPSHAAGDARYVQSLALAAAAAGADGLMIEVHADPVSALCDGTQSLTPEAFAILAEKLRALRSVL